MNKTIVGIFSFLLLTGCTAVTPSTTPEVVEVVQANVVVKEMVASYQEYQVQRLVAVEQVAKEKPEEITEKKEAIRGKKNTKVKVQKKVKIKRAKTIKKVEEPKVKKKIVVKKPAIKKPIAKKPIAKKPIAIKTVADCNKTFRLSFYSELPEHNGGYTITARGEKLSQLNNVVASNYYPIGTKIYLKGYGTVRVADRGGSDFNSSQRLDVLVPRRNGESKSAYIARIWSMGRKITKGHIVK